MAADVIDYKIYGQSLQLIEIELDPGEGVRAEVGTMIYMEEGINMPSSSGGGLFAGFKRMLTGEGFFISTFLNHGMGKSRVGFAAPYPGEVIPLDLAQLGGEFLCQKDSFICAAKGIEIQVAFTKRLGAGFFGGEGFILQKLQGDGMAFIHAGGAIIEKDLAVGEKLRVDTGCLVAFAPSVHYEIRFIGGFRNALFGGEGLFLAQITGPGKVFLQSLPFSRLAERITATLPNLLGETESSKGGGFLGGLLGAEDKG